MLNTRLINALKKAGATVTELTRHFACPDHMLDDDTKKFNKHFEAEANGLKIDWYTEKNWNKSKGCHDGKLGVSFVTRRSPHTDIMTDCFCDSYRDTIKGALGLLGL
jgi:hypothetical protein